MTREGTTVWIVEDDPDARASMVELLNHAPDMHCAESFASAESLFDHLNHGGWAPDVILMDIELPGISGIDAVDRLRIRCPGAAVIMVTIHEDADTIYKALCKGALGYLVKGASLTEIVTAVEDVRTGGAALPPAIAHKVIDMFRQLNPITPDYGLTPAEDDVLRLLAEGNSIKKIAAARGVTRNTVSAQLRSVYRKLHVNSNIEAVAKAIRERLV